MADKKNVEAAPVEAAPVEAAPVDDGMVDYELFYDGRDYSAPVFVGVNGKGYMIQRGKKVRIPKAVAEVLDNSKAQDRHTADMIQGYEEEYAEKAEALN